MIKQKSTVINNYYFLTLTMKITILITSLLATSAFGFTPSSHISNLRHVTALSMAAETSANNKEIKVGVIGCGRIGIVHLGAITKAPNVTPIIVSNPTISMAEQDRYSGVCVVPRPHALAAGTVTVRYGPRFPGSDCCACIA